jgi:hypothetical protein
MSKMPRFGFGIRLLALLAVSHASLVLVAWSLILSLHPARSPLFVLIPSTIGALLLAPCATTIFAFTIWTVRGFAP